MSKAYSIMKYGIFSIIVLVLFHTMWSKRNLMIEGYGRGGHGKGGGHGGGYRHGGGHGGGYRHGGRGGGYGYGGGGGWGWGGWDYPWYNRGYYQTDYPVYYQTDYPRNYPWYYPSYIIGGQCKNGCGNLGNGEVGCVNPGYGYDNCIFASDCTGCVF